MQKDVAAILGVDTTTINNWERNRCQPRLCLFPKIIQFLGYSPFPAKKNPSVIDEIKAYRITHGLSQKNLAKIIGIDPTTLARWEKGKAAPSKKLGQRVVGVIDLQLSGNGAG
jgi:DNA-binding XRE family transcriptional regulator